MVFFFMHHLNRTPLILANVTCTLLLYVITVTSGLRVYRYNNVLTDCGVKEEVCKCERYQWYWAKISCNRLAAKQFPVFEDTDREIHTLTIIYAGLKELPNRAFYSVRATNIELQGNDLKNHIATRAFDGLGETLHALNLAWDNISVLDPKLFRGLINLRNLTLAENKITTLPVQIFQDLRSLERLSIAGNPMISLAGHVFRFQTNLQSLDIGYCKLITLGRSIFSGMWNLKFLDMRGNQFESFPLELFVDLYSLKTLLLSHNPIRRLQTGVFRGLVNLQNLELKESLLEYIAPGVFSDTKVLKMLDLGDNRLHIVSESVLDLPQLEYLSLDGNILTDVPKDVSRMASLTHLDLSYNQIRTLKECDFHRLERLDFLNVRENPFDCDCDLYWVRYLQTTLLAGWDQTRMLPFVPGQCSMPRRLRDTGITNWVDLSCMDFSSGHRLFRFCSRS